MSKDLKERLKKKKQELASSGKKGNVLYIGEGTTRVRILPTKGEDFVAEVSHVFLSKDMGSIYSADTFGEPCPVAETYQELKKSKDDDDNELAKRLLLKKAYLIPVVVYDDEKGKKIDKEKSGKLMKIAGGVYNNIIDLYLDSEWGDMTDPKEGFDIKIIRTGKSMNDTEYTIAPCKNSELNKEFAKKKFDLDKAVRELILPYDAAKEKLEEFLGTSLDDDDKKGKKKKKNKGKASDDFKSKDKKKDKKSDKKEDKKSDKKKAPKKEEKAEKGPKVKKQLKKRKK